MLDTSDFKGWPNGDGKPILELCLTPVDIENRYRIVFKREKDDLDWLLASHFIDSIVGPIVMMRHENSPSTGTIVYVDINVDSNEALERVKHILGLKITEVAWEAVSS